MQLGDQSRVGAKLLTRRALLKTVRVGKDCFGPAYRQCSKYWTVALYLCQGGLRNCFGLCQGCRGGEPNLIPLGADYIAERESRRQFALKQVLALFSVVAGAKVVVPVFCLTEWMP
jgi:hypothetical protein